MDFRICWDFCKPRKPGSNSVVVVVAVEFGGLEGEEPGSEGTVWDGVGTGDVEEPGFGGIDWEGKGIGGVGGAGIWKSNKNLNF